MDVLTIYKERELELECDNFKDIVDVASYRIGMILASKKEEIIKELNNNKSYSFKYEFELDYVDETPVVSVRRVK